jgi:hypothetical protein
MKCHTNVNSTPPTQLLHTFSYIVAILIHIHFESPNTYSPFRISNMTSGGGKSNHRKLSRKNNMNGVRATGTGVSDKK